ncbi:MAG: hypothetical protein KAS72_02220 [Phycisphaerales bacterium]|nr:hypothetical protein [Phycisphaerales bacterium]
MFIETYPDPQKHGVDLLIEREEAEVNREHNQRIEHAVGLVAQMIQDMATGGRWYRSPKKRAAGLAMVALFGDDEDLRVFLNRTLGADGRFVDLWVAKFLCEKFGLSVTNNTIKAMLKDLAEVGEAIKPLVRIAQDSDHE